MSTLIKDQQLSSRTMIRVVNSLSPPRSLKMVPFEILGTVSYSHSIATMAVSLAVSTQYTNVTDTQPLHDSKSRAYP